MGNEEKLEGNIRKHKWIDNFESEFNPYLKDESKDTLKIIVGQSPYKQSLNNKQFKVTNQKYPYDKLGGYVAFFVTDWIKIQDSLEMIGNLLFNKSTNSLTVLAYLRENSINASEFSDYLYYKYRIILTNISYSKPYDNIKNIESIINILGISTILLTVGKDAHRGCKKMNVSNIHRYKCIHPSGNNLNNGRYNDYYNNWYNLIDDNNKSLAGFSIFK